MKTVCNVAVMEGDDAAVGVANPSGARACVQVVMECNESGRVIQRGQQKT